MGGNSQEKTPTHGRCLMVEVDSIVAKGNVSSVLDYLPHLARLSAVVTLSVLGTSVRADPVTSKGSR